jgi:transcriptional regulator with XRE-family HTH domain
METTPTPLHAAVEARRLELGWSQPALAERSGIGQSHISKIERGAVTPKPETIERLARALGVDPVPWLMAAQDWLDKERAAEREAKLTAELRAAEALPANTPRGRLVRLCALLTDEQADWLTTNLVQTMVRSNASRAAEEAG